MEEAMKPFLAPALCANNNKKCLSTASLPCAACKMVQYCSNECKQAHWNEHTKDCGSKLMALNYVPAWIRENRIPHFIANNPAPQVRFGKKHYLWGNMPALDILKMKDNEGLGDLGRDIGVLFAASGDCRNIIKTIAGLPEGYNGKLNIVFNDMDFYVTARNIIIFLAAFQLPPESSVPIIIHLWYSAFIPRVMLELLGKEVLPLVQDVCNKIRGTQSGSNQAKTFRFANGSGSLRVVLKKEEWLQLPSFFQVPKGLTRERAIEIRKKTTLHPDRRDYIDRALYPMSRGQRMGCWAFRDKGILLPFGCSTTEFDTPNPTFFHDDQSEWPMMDSANPLNGWLQADYTHAPSSFVASADTYGALFFFLRSLLLNFCNRLAQLNPDLQAYCVDARELPLFLPGDGKSAFDRIDISNISDRCYVGPQKALELFSPLLRTKAQNPKATLLFLFLNAVKEMEQGLGPGYIISDTRRRMSALEAIIGRDALRAIAIGRQSAQYNPKAIQFQNSLDMFGDFDNLFEIFVQMTRMDETARSVGLKARKTHTIVENWPYRVNERTTKEDFDRLSASDESGWERYVEFERI